MTLDRMFYLVVSDHAKAGPLIFEVELSRMDRASVLTDISHGQYGAVLHILEFNPVEHICQEVTYDREFREAVDRRSEEPKED